jgi:hypothetical protein
MGTHDENESAGVRRAGEVWDYLRLKERLHRIEERLRQLDRKPVPGDLLRPDIVEIDRVAAAAGMLEDRGYRVSIEKFAGALRRAEVDGARIRCSRCGERGHIRQTCLKGAAPRDPDVSTPARADRARLEDFQRFKRVNGHLYAVIRRLKQAHGGIYRAADLTEEDRELLRVVSEDAKALAPGRRKRMEGKLAAFYAGTLVVRQFACARCQELGHTADRCSGKRPVKRPARARFLGL